ncbi:hypothetical protein QZH41_019821, partial [Actinostola sp. cb2023]
LSYIGQEAQSIPGIIGRKYGKLVTRLDLSFNQLRLYVLYKLPKLKFLDSTPVKESEREEAKRIGSFMKVVTPTDSNVVSINIDY